MDGRHHQRHGSAGGGAGRQEGNLWGQARSVFMSAILAEPPAEIRREVTRPSARNNEAVMGAAEKLLSGNDIRIVRRRDSTAAADAADAAAGDSGQRRGEGRGEGEGREG
ncbi:hypothetical protein CLOM_g504 [Closterium sp. NIES-68]|nr:hypothetical protein CLOM_g504 [Closterium sp. NIES-68]